MLDQIPPASLAQWLQSLPPTAKPVVLDVREPWEWQTASVQAEGFELLTVPMGDIPARLSELDPQQPIACLCHHGARSQRVGLYLLQNGFEQVVNIAGGIDAWSQQLDARVPRY
jgi:rhodanese-related sulfurtransferase